MGQTIEVHVHGEGVAVGETATDRPDVVARCEVCGQTQEAVAAVGAAGKPPIFACAGCLRERLEAMSVARWRFRAASQGGLPWGKITS